MGEVGWGLWMVAQNPRKGHLPCGVLSGGPAHPARSPELSLTAAGPPAPPATPWVSDAARTDSGLACLDFPSLLNDFRDVITVEGDELERTGALKA